MTETALKPMLNAEFWNGRRVFLTGHTGFKGAWLVAILRHLGSVTGGYALAPDTTPNLFDAAGIAGMCNHRIGDVRDSEALVGAIRDFKPEIIIHMAAQSLVRRSYRDPLETVQVNILGTANLLEACRAADSIRAVVNVTTDKCYENRNQAEGYRETDPLGGKDPYSASKACSEIITGAYRESFFNAGGDGLALASARAGNVIGGGDWCEDRIIPDAVRAFSTDQPLVIRNAIAVRPWQHVLEPVSGYLLLAERLAEQGAAYAKGWNFGPESGKVFSVAQVVEEFAGHWPGPTEWEAQTSPDAPHEAQTLVLDSTLAGKELGWRARLGFKDAVRLTAEWYAIHHTGADTATLAGLLERQIADYLDAIQPEA
ncbi:MAG: CDP-glucose 4,6-dehydratase [Rhodospirillales bacterium]|nr:CDP-glucose 4,6-dehydratase [Rhodospirillales bacterium]